MKVNNVTDVTYKHFIIGMEEIQKCVEFYDVGLEHLDAESVIAVDRVILTDGRRERLLKNRHLPITPWQVAHKWVIFYSLQEAKEVTYEELEKSFFSKNCTVKSLGTSNNLKTALYHLLKDKVIINIRDGNITEGIFRLRKSIKE